MAIATLDSDTNRPRSFHVPFANVTDHRTGEKRRAGQGSGIVVEEWSRDSGIRMVNLGVDLKNTAAANDDGAAIHTTLTDHARVTAEIIDPESGAVVARHDAGVLDAGPQTIRFGAEDYLTPWDAREYRVAVVARSTYDEEIVAKTDLTIELQTAGSPALPDHLTILGNWPNPFNPSTTIRFVAPQGPARDYALKVYDVRGKLVRDLATGRTAGGLIEATWNGHNNNGETVSSGVYLYRLDVGQEQVTGKMVLVK
jgi:hypothetical protein